MIIISPQQFVFAEFYRLLVKLIKLSKLDSATVNEENFPNCKAETINTISQIIDYDYPYKEDDIEYIMDMVNYYIRKTNYLGKKSRFPMGKYLDKVCSEELYIDSFMLLK